MQQQTPDEVEKCKADEGWGWCRLPKGHSGSHQSVAQFAGSLASEARKLSEDMKKILEQK